METAMDSRAQIGSGAAFSGALSEWQPLLQALASDPSPVGAAIHWVRSQGFSAPLGRRNDKHLGSLPSRLWRFVPDLLAFKVPVLCDASDAQHQEKRQRTSVMSSCMWMQTLPTVMQINILSFLSAEHYLFHSKDLELLSQNLLTDPEQDFWVGRAVQDLLSKVSDCSPSIQEENVLFCEKQYSLPDWLEEYRHRRVLPWLCKKPSGSELGTSDQACNPSGACLGTNSIAVRKSLEENTRDTTKTHPDNEECLQDDVPGLQTPCPTEGHERIATSPVASPLERKNEEPSESQELRGTPTKSALKSNNASGGMVGSTLDELQACALLLKKNWQEAQPTTADISLLRDSLDPVTLLKLVEPWEMPDDLVLSLIETGIRKEDGFLWSAQMISYCLLPKLISLQQPASRVLITAVLQAARVHARAAVDALLVPLVLSSEGPNTGQCDAINRATKECVPADYILSFCAKILLHSRRQLLPFELPMAVPCDYISRPLLWSESLCTVLQNILSRALPFDKELVDGLVNACEEAVNTLSKSLKFSNLLLCFISNYGSHLKLQKSVLQRIVEKTDTFITKSLRLKTLAL